MCGQKTAQRVAKTVIMSQQAASGQGEPARLGGGQGRRNMRYHPCAEDATKGFKSPISKIMMDTYNEGQKRLPHSSRNLKRTLQTTFRARWRTRDI
jgi:hypothetical protein